MRTRRHSLSSAARGSYSTRIMSSVGFDTNRDMLIANVVKCRPPDNRNPRAEEAAECIAYLQRQIELVKPKVILAAGRNGPEAHG